MKTSLFFLLLALASPNYQALGQAVPATRLDAAAHLRSVLAFQQDLNREFSDAKESPLSAAERQQFKLLPFYPTGYGYYVEATLVRDSTSAPFPMQTSTERRPLYRKYGELHFTLQGQAQHLSIYQNLELAKRPGFEDYLFVPFTDLTNGHGSYGGGRYIDLRMPPAGARTMLLDFNRAYNPSCAYNHAYSCPVPPPENRLSIAIPAGVQSTH